MVYRNSQRNFFLVYSIITVIAKNSYSNADVALIVWWKKNARHALQMKPHYHDHQSLRRIINIVVGFARRITLFSENVTASGALKFGFQWLQYRPQSSLSIEIFYEYF